MTGIEGQPQRALGEADAAPASAEGAGYVAVGDMHHDHIREDGTVDDTYIETHYVPFDGVEPGPGYLRIYCDAEGCDIETRIPYDVLTSMGWTPPNKVST